MQNAEVQRSPEHILIGMGGWELPDFRGVFYPAKAEKGFRKLAFYSQFFDLIEVNASFYNTALSPHQAEQWLQDVHANQQFEFTVKLYRGFTHTFDATKKDAHAVHRLLEPLRIAGKLGGLVIQFSSSYHFNEERQSYFKKLRATFPEDRLLVDLRHASWEKETFYQFCNELGINLVNVDLPPLPYHRPWGSSSNEGVAYFRMMGRNVEAWKKPNNGDRYFYPYSEAELDELVHRIKQLNAEKTYVVFHNDRQAFSLTNGKQVEHALHPHKKLFAPTSLISKFPQLQSFCEPIGMNVHNNPSFNFV
jgi:uncharacterized protein YecE (DUF72 family)